jgi:hypothetical protein
MSNLESVHRSLLIRQAGRKPYAKTVTYWQITKYNGVAGYYEISNRIFVYDSRTLNLAQNLNRPNVDRFAQGGFIVLEIVVVVLLLLWLIGMVSGQLFGGIIHLLIIAALLIFVISLVTRRRAI